jgi:hypothetical protein
MSLGRTAGYALCGRRIDLGGSHVEGTINSPKELWPVPENTCFFCRKVIKSMPGFPSFENAKNVRYPKERAINAILEEESRQISVGDLI